MEVWIEECGRAYKSEWTQSRINTSSTEVVLSNPVGKMTQPVDINKPLSLA